MTETLAELGERYIAAMLAADEAQAKRDEAFRRVKEIRTRAMTYKVRGNEVEALVASFELATAVEAREQAVVETLAARDYRNAMEEKYWTLREKGESDA